MEATEAATSPVASRANPADSIFSFPVAPTGSAMPAAPTGPVAVASRQESEEERALRELQASMM